MIRRPRAEGFSLPEVLIAITVFGFTCIALTSMLLLNVRQNREAKEKTIATSLAQSKVEELRGPLSGPPASGTDSPTVEGLQYTRTWTVTTPTGLPSGVSQVQVRVSWREPEVPALSLFTYVTY